MPDPRDKISKTIRALEKEMLAFLKALISIPTVNPPGDRYADCVEFLGRKCRALGMRTQVVRAPWADAKYPRYSLIARLPGTAAKTLHVNGHFDVVPVTSSWQRSPFKPKLEGHRLYGRGACDMKGGIAAAIFALQAIQKAGIRPAYNLEFSFVCDEETDGAMGAGYLVRKKLVRPDMAIVAEGGEGDWVAHAHKGVVWFEVTVLGRPAHASRPDLGVNAFEKMAALVRYLEKWKGKLNRRKTRLDAEIKTPTLVMGGEHRGGAKINVVPDTSVFTLDRRVLPEEKIREVVREFHAAVRAAEKKIPGLTARVRELSIAEPALMPLDHPLCREFAAAFRRATGKTPRLSLSSGFLDMRYFTNDGGIPTVAYGVDGGNFHGDDEYVDVDSLFQTTKIFANFYAGNR